MSEAVDYIYSTPVDHANMMSMRLSNMLRGVILVECLSSDRILVRSETKMPELIMVDEYYVSVTDPILLINKINLVETRTVYKWQLTIRASVYDTETKKIMDVTDSLITEYRGILFPFCQWSHCYFPFIEYNIEHIEATQSDNISALITFDFLSSNNILINISEYQDLHTIECPWWDDDGEDIMFYVKFSLSEFCKV